MVISFTCNCNKLKRVASKYWVYDKNTHPSPYVYGLGVGDWRQLGVDARRLSGHGEEGGDP